MAIKAIHDYEIAMLEHDSISEQEVLEWKPEELQWYLTGMHDFANRIIEMIREKEEF